MTACMIFRPGSLGDLEQRHERLRSAVLRFSIYRPTSWSIRPVYTPPYCPWFNPVEFAFSVVKRRRKLHTQTEIPEFHPDIIRSLEQVTSDKCVASSTTLRGSGARRFAPLKAGVAGVVIKHGRLRSRQSARQGSSKSGERAEEREGCPRGLHDPRRCEPSPEHQRASFQDVEANQPGGPAASPMRRSSRLHIMDALPSP
jgi:hypothetical protein